MGTRRARRGPTTLRTTVEPFLAIDFETSHVERGVPEAGSRGGEGGSGDEGGETDAGDEASVCE